MIRVLHVIGAMDRAGAETMIMNYYRNIDRDAIQFDFLVHTDRHCDYDEEIEAIGGKIYRIPRFNGMNYFSYKAACREFFKNHPEHDIVHGHIESSAWIYLPEARNAGKATIAHAHQSKGPLSASEIAFRLITARNKHSAERYMACSKQAGIDRYGEAITNSGRFEVLPNAIDLQSYAFDPQRRHDLRQELGLGEDPTFGHIGRFTAAKNHPFLIRVFTQIKREIPNAQLVLVGRGENEEMTRELVRSLGLEDSVHFLGVRDDVDRVLNALDVFLFPSLWEGLGIVAIEAQANGLPTLISDAVPDEVAILPSTKRLPLDDIQVWVDASLAALETARKQGDHVSSKLTDYDIVHAAKRLEDYYQSLT